jgi:hypothetical protein
MTSTLELLLIQLRDGPSDADTLARARALARVDERIPEDVRAIVLVDPADAEADAAGLLAVLGADDLGAHLAEAIRAEAGSETRVARTDEVDERWAEIAEVLREGLVAEAASFEVAGAVMRRIGAVDFAWGPVLVDAVAREAGAADVADSVLGSVAALGGEEGHVAEAVLAEAGTVDVVDGVLVSLGLQRLAVREAVLAEAGSVDVAGAVSGSLAIAALPLRDAVVAEAGSVDVVSAVLRELGLGQEPVRPEAPVGVGRASLPASADPVGVGRAPLPASADPVGVGRASLPASAHALAAAANNTRFLRGLRRFSVAAIAIAAVSLVTFSVAEWMGASSTAGGEPLLFARAGDVVIEDLSYGDDVQVLQIEGDDGAVILWVDEEA